MITSLKTCFKCHIEKPLDEFYKHSQMGDGHLNKCKECAKKDVADRYINKFDQVSAYVKNRFKTTHRKIKILEYQRKRRARYPEKNRARKAVHIALRSGRIIKQPCKCGSINVQAHHADYSKPLDVEWMCFSCHRVHHGQMIHILIERKDTSMAKSTVVFEVKATTKELTPAAQAKAVSTALKSVAVSGVKLVVKKQKLAA